MSREGGWIVLASFGARWEADLLVHALRAAKVPVLVDGPDPGLFGPGFSGGFSPGVRVKVPAEFADHAEEIRSVFEPGPYIPLDDTPDLEEE
jgi:hypothetical protein